MDINQAVTVIEEFLEAHRTRGPWKPDEIRVRPSGDDADHIKIWFGFTGPRAEGEDFEALKQGPITALRAAHPELAQFQLEVRAEII